MSEVGRFNRFLQFAYPSFVFISFLLAWNSVVQVNGFADSNMTGLEPNPSSRSSPAQVQNSCSARQLTSLEAHSCAEEGSQPAFKLIDTNDLSGESIVPVGAEAVVSLQQLTNPI